MSIEDNKRTSPAEEIVMINKDLTLILSLLKHGHQKDKNTFKPWLADEVHKTINALIPFLKRKEFLYNQTGDSSSAEKQKTKILALQEISGTLHGASPIDQNVLNQIRSIF